MVKYSVAFANQYNMQMYVLVSTKGQIVELEYWYVIILYVYNSSNCLTIFFNWMVTNMTCQKTESVQITKETEYDKYIGLLIKLF